MWTIVHFITDNSVEPVPTYWLNHNSTKCAWPNNDSLIAKYRANKTRPNGFDFSYYDCRVLSTNILSFTDALDKAKRGLYTSDVDDIDAQTTSNNRHKKSIAIEKLQNKFSKPSVNLHQSTSTSSINYDINASNRYPPEVSSIIIDTENTGNTINNTGLQRKSTFAKTPKNSLKRLNTTLLDTSDLKILKEQNINEKKKKYMKDKASIVHSTPQLINCNDDVDNNQCSSEISSINDDDDIADKDYNPLTTNQNIDLESGYGNNNKFGLADMMDGDESINDYGNDESNIAADNFITSSKKVTPTINNEQKKNETPNPIETSNYSCTLQSSSLFTANNEKFQKTIINYLAFLKVEICKISNRQEELFELFNNSQYSRPLTAADEHNFEIDYFVSNWPISDINGITYMESKIKSDNSFQKLIVCELARTGGKSLPNMIYKIMKKVFADQVLTEYTYYGLRNKNNFSVLSINKAIFEAIKKSKFKSCCDDEVITAIAKWLTSAKGRLEKKNQQ